MIRASGRIGVAIAVMSFYLVALVVWMFLHYRSPVMAPRELVERRRGPAGPGEVQRGLPPAGGR